MYDPNVLVHHGVKGMKWGVHRTKEQLGHMFNTRKRIKQIKKLQAEIDSDADLDALQQLSHKYIWLEPKVNERSAFFYATRECWSMSEMASQSTDRFSDMPLLYRSGIYERIHNLLNNPETSNPLRDKLGKQQVADLERKYSKSKRETKLSEDFDEVTYRIESRGGHATDKEVSRLTQINQKLRDMNLDYPGIDKYLAERDSWISELEKNNTTKVPIPAFEYPYVDVTKDALDVLTVLHDDYFNKLDRGALYKKLRNGLEE